MNAPHTLGQLLHSFFEDYLPCQKGLQPTTIRSYRDAVVLYLHFAAQERRCKLTRLQPQDLACERVVRFLRHLETQRGNTVATRNQRLAALRSLFDYAGGAHAGASGRGATPGRRADEEDAAPTHAIPAARRGRVAVQEATVEWTAGPA